MQTALLIHAFSARPRGQYGRDWGKTRARPRRYPRFSRFASGLTTTKLTGPLRNYSSFWYKGCFSHLHTYNQEKNRPDCNRLNMGVDNRYVESRLDVG